VVTIDVGQAGANGTTSFSDCPHRDAIAADGGQAPVAKQSGKRKQAKFRWACNKRLRNALSTLAHSTRLCNPWPLTATPAPASAATTTVSRYAHSAAPGAASSGAAGNTEHGTPSDTPACNIIYWS